jgi:hypothetical protein
MAFPRSRARRCNRSTDFAHHDDEVILLQERIETVADDADLEDVYNTERHLLYVACTLAIIRWLVVLLLPHSFWTVGAE